MEEILIVILQFLLEFFFDSLLNLLFDWPLFGKATSESGKTATTCFRLFCAGCAVAGISLLWFQHTLIAYPVLRILNLFLSPIAAAYISQWFAKQSAKSDQSIVPRNHFWRAFWFTLGFVTVRFAFVARG